MIKASLINRLQAKQFGVVGNPVAHSLSPIIHQSFAKAENLCLRYEKIELDIADFERKIKFFFAHDVKGLNITAPFKKQAFECADVLTARAKKAGAANTLWCTDNKIYADNTDGIGFMRDINRYICIVNKSILIIGAGGAARGVISSLLEAPVNSLMLINRTISSAQRLQQDFPAIGYVSDVKSIVNKSFDLIINTTPMDIKSLTAFLPMSIWQSKPLCFDLAYNLSASTPLVTLAHHQQCIALDGIGMLIEQAAEAFYCWHKIMPDTKPVHRLFMRQKMLAHPLASPLCHQYQAGLIGW